MRRSRVILTALLMPLATLVVVGCLYRGYLTSILPSCRCALPSSASP